MRTISNLCRSPLGLAVLASVSIGAAGCAGTGGTTGNQNSANDNASSNTNDNAPPSGAGRISVTLHGELGSEQYMRALVFVGPRAVSRGEAGNPGALNAVGFSNTDFTNATEPGDVTRQVAASPGDVVTIVAIESEGINSGPVSYPEVNPPSDAAIEFVSFGGAPVGAVGPGVGTISGGSDATVIVNFRRMPQIALWLWGATAAHVEFDIPDVLGLPGGANPNDRAYDLPGLTAAPDPAMHLSMQYKTGSTVLMYYVPRGDEAPFLRWEGDCSGNGECTLTFGGPSGTTAFQEATVVAVYWKCEFGGPPAYGSGTALDPACTRIEP